MLAWLRRHTWRTSAAVLALVMAASCEVPVERASDSTDATGVVTDRAAEAIDDPADAEPSNAGAGRRDRPRRVTGHQAAGAAKRASKTKPAVPGKARGHRKGARPVKPNRPPRKARWFHVLRVVDGDTVEVSFRGGESVRVIGIDTPETVHPSVPDECWGAAASAAATRLLAGKRVKLRFDGSQGRRDAYGRLLAYLVVPGVGDFGHAMVRRGHAVEYTYDTAYRHQARYRNAERVARSKRHGLWRHCGGADRPLRSGDRQGGRPRGVMSRPGGGRCAPGYRPCVPPYPPDVDCADVDGPIHVRGADPHGLDGDGDGVACES